MILTLPPNAIGNVEFINGRLITRLIFTSSNTAVFHMTNGETVVCENLTEQLKNDFLKHFRDANKSDAVQ